MVIISSNDLISPKRDIHDMIASWNIKNVWYNNARHLHSIKTYSSIYKKKIDKIYEELRKKISRKRNYASNFWRITYARKEPTTICRTAW